MVLLDRRARSDDLCSVSVNDVRGGELAIRHLLETGHRRIAFVGGPRGLEQVRDRYRGAAKAVRAAGLDPAQVLRRIDTATMTVPAGREAADRLLELPRSQRPSAVFCANDLLALGVLQGLTRQRARVPDDSPWSATTTSTSPPRRRCRCLRYDSPASGSVGRRPSCSSTR